MGNQFVEATERAVAKLVTDFQGNPSRFWNERDLHWSLFYYLKQDGVIQEDYVTQLIRAEFPTLKKFDNARGHYDFVILDPQSYRTEAVQRMKAQEPWEEYLKLIKVMIAVEIKLWLARLPSKRADWDIQKLTEQPNNVHNAYFLNFVQLNFTRPYAVTYYLELRDYLMRYKRRCPALKILCVPSEIGIQPDPSDNWLSTP